jgi:enamine deaminase RidA (YjgF/YER057c/UK114 family)
MKMQRIVMLGALIGGCLLCVAAFPQKTSKQFLNLDGAKPPGYTHVVTSPPGRMIFISGQGGTRDDKLPEDFASQATNTFENIRRCLALGGAKFEDVVKVNYYVTDIKNMPELRRIRANYLNMNAPPAATLVQAGLSGGMLLEVEVIAIVPEQR